MADMLVLWDVDGNEVREELPPMEHLDLLRNLNDVSFDIGSIVGKLKEISNSEVLALHQLSDSVHCVIDASLRDGRHYIIKVLVTGDLYDATVLGNLFKRECAVMRWISSATSIPVPKVIYFDDDPSLSYSVMEKCEGSMLTDVFGSLPFQAKMANMRSFARIAIELFNLPAPDGIGGIEFLPTDSDSAKGPLSLVPSILSVHIESPSQVFHSIKEYFTWLIEAKLRSPNIGLTEADRNEAQTTLTRLEELISKSVAGYDNALLKSVLSHEDLVAHNVLIDDEGIITGVIDWEFHMIKPAVLAVAYPSWISTIDARFVDRDSQFTPYACVSELDSEKLHQAYDSIVEEMDKTYFRALKAGRFCRAAESKLIINVVDIGCQRIKEWLETL